MTNARLRDLFKSDANLKPQMYKDYLEYYTNKGIDPATLMSYDEWQRHLHIENY